MPEASTVRIEYQASEVHHQSGVKSNEVKGGDFGAEFIGNQRVVGGGNGTYITAGPSHLILRVRVGNEEHEIWIERLFKELLGIRRLTKKTRSRIEAAMPSTVLVNEQWGRRGRKYYTLSEGSATDWALRVTK